jgi:signal transduction histidine kinase
MWSARSLALHAAAREARGVPAAGPAMTVLGTMLTRIAAIIRGVAAGYVLVQVVIWHAYYQADPARLWGPAVAVGWAVAAVCYLRGHRFPPGPLVCLDWAVYAVLAVAAGGCVPLAIRGQAGEWLFVTVASGLLVQVWFSPPRLSMPLSLASGLAFWAGSLLAPGLHTARGARAASVALLFVVVMVHWSGRQLLHRRASRADRALAVADQDARDQFVILSRTIERREHDRLLHDTVLNTLTALARLGSGPAAEVTGQCWHDVTLVEHLLGAAGGPAQAGYEPLGDLRIGLDAVASEMRSRGLVVHVGAVPDGAAGPALPPPVCTALAQAAREALANVLSHAGTGEAWVDIAAAGPAPPGGLRVTVRDEGAGFDPGQVGPSRLGLRRSIVERMADCGGQAVVRSAPGQGTVVSLSWPC